MKNAPRHIHSDDTSELLSSYIDDAVDLVERRRVDKLLRECNACVMELEDLRGLRQLLQHLPEPMPRRSFTLDASVAAPRMRLFPIFRFASLAAALLLFVVLGVDALGRGGQGGQLTTASQPAAEVAPLAQEQSRTIDSAATAAPEAATAKEPPSAAGGAATEPTAEAAAEIAPDVAALQVPATAAAATGEEQEAPAQDSPVEPTMDIAGAAPEQGPGLDDEQNNDSADAPADPDAVLESSAALSNNDTSSPDTTTLEEAQALPGEPVNRPWQDSWRVAEALLAALVVALGGATWWSARQERV